MRDVVYTELGEARRQVLHQRAFAVLESEGARAAELAYHALLAGEVEAAYRFSVQAGIEAVAVFAVSDAIGHYEQARALLQESQQMQTELLALAQVHAGQVPGSIRSSRRAFALSQESKNAWVHVASTNALTYGLLEAGAYEEAFELTQHTMAFARTLPPTINFQHVLTALGSTYQALQQWEEARSTLAEADAMAETLDLGRLRTPALSQLCMNYAVTGEWEQAHTYAVQAIAIRKSKSADMPLLLLDFYRTYEMEALLRAGDERQVREAVRRLEERLGSNRRFRIPYLRSSAILAAWEGEREQAINHLREAAEIGLPAEQWQIQAALGSVYETAGEQGQARAAFGEAARIIQELAQSIRDETLRSRFLAGPQIHPVLQHAQRLATSIPDDHTEPSGL